MSAGQKSHSAPLVWIFVSGCALAIFWRVLDRACCSDGPSLQHRMEQWFNTSTFGAVVTWTVVGIVYVGALAIVTMSTVFLVIRRRLVARAMSAVGTVEHCVDVAGDGGYRLGVLYHFGAERRADVLSEVWHEFRPGEQVEIWFDPKRPEIVDLVERYPTTLSRIKAVGFVLPAWTLLIWSAVLFIGDAVWNK